MSRSRRRFLVQVGGYLLLPVARTFGTEATDVVSWQTDLALAHRRCVVEKRPMLLFVTTDGCPYCLKMMRSTYVDAGVAKEASDSFVLTVVNANEQASIVKQMGVRIYPTTYIFDPTQGLIDRIEGFMPPDQLRKRLATASRRLAQATGSARR